jgi:serine/threonine protein kinase
MAALTTAGQTGVLPILDLDPSDSPQWFVMPRAEMLSERLGTSPDLSDVVEAVAHLASTLVILAGQGIAHRDLKPPNLFWLDREAVLGDLGIATWPQRGDRTKAGDKVGAAYFLAQEARRHNAGIDYARADVWSLAKCLFVLARPELGPYPPDGTHYGIGREFSLWGVGQEAGLALAPLLEAATQFQPHFRLRMAGFRDELRDWLQLHPVGTVERPSHPGVRRGWRAFDGEMEQFRRRSRAMRSALDAEMRALATHYLANDRLWTRDGSELEPEASALVSHEFPPNSEDGFEPDDSYFAATSRLDSHGRRIVLWAALDNAAITMFAEIQRVVGTEVNLERYCWREASVLLPSCQARLSEMHDEVVRWA